MFFKSAGHTLDIPIDVLMALMAERCGNALLKEWIVIHGTEESEWTAEGFDTEDEVKECLVKDKKSGPEGGWELEGVLFKGKEVDVAFDVAVALTIPSKE